MGDDTLILIAGMHRSGTSASARVVNLLGASLGDEAGLMAPQADNPRGFWEAQDFSRLNERLLLALGGSWDHPPVVRDGWAGLPGVLPWRHEAEQLLARLREDGARVHAVKDPRFSLTLPLWLDIDPQARVVVPIREPRAVCLSLLRRNGIPISQGAGLWLRYVRDCVTHAEAPLLVDYADLLADPHATARTLAEELGLPTPDEHTLEAVAGSLDPELDHGAPVDPDDLGPELALAQAAYEQLRQDGAPALRADQPVVSATPPSDATRPVVVLHIGAEGAGGSALQGSLDTSRAALSSAGVLYPRSVGRRQHWILSTYAMDEHRTNAQSTAMGPDFHADRPAWRGGVEEGLGRELRDSTARCVVLSTELLHSQLVSVEEIRRVHDLLAPWAGEFRVVVYLRRQDRALLSRLGGAPLEIGPAVQRTWDYAHVLDMWAEVFGRYAVRPRVHDDVALTGRDLVEDFVLAAELPVDPALVVRHEEAEPPPLSAKAVQVVSEFNAASARGDMPADVQRRVRPLVSQVARETFPGPASRPTADRARQVVELFSASNDRVAQEWFGRPRLFDERYDGYADEDTPPVPLTSRDVMTVTVRLATALDQSAKTSS
jgi:hypothetical protein